MGKTVTHVAQFTDPTSQYTPGPDKTLLVVACDEGSIYEFQKFADTNQFNLKSRGGRNTPVHEWGQSRAILPGDVKEQLNEVLGKKGWVK